MISRYRSSSAKTERLLHFLQAFDQRVNLVGGVVDVEARPGGAGNVEMPHQHLTTVVPHSNSDALVVQYGAHVMGVDLTEVECGHATPLTRIFRPVERDLRNIAQRFDGVGHELTLMLPYVVHTQVREIVDCRAEGDDITNIWSASLEFPGKLVVSGVIVIDTIDHLTTPEERWHRF